MLEMYSGMVESLLKEIALAEAVVKESPDKQSQIDIKISDILHFSESKEKHRACDSARYFKMLGNLRRERREAKEVLDVAREFIKLGKSIKIHLKNTNKMFEGIKCRKGANYNIRYLTEEFGEVIKGYKKEDSNKSNKEETND